MGAALVANDELPGHVDGWLPFVPVKGVEDVLILCLNPALLNTQEIVSLQCVIWAGCLVTGLLNCWQFLSCPMLCFFVGSIRIPGGWRVMP